MQYSSDVIYWLALRRIPQWGPATLRRKRDAAQDVKAVWTELSTYQPEVETYLEAARQELAAIESSGVQVLTIDHPDYPDLLRDITEISPVLYAKGKLHALGQPTVSIVGTRHPSSYGVDVTQRLTQQLVGANYAIVSGMAKGIDAVAHRAAIAAGGSTIAVWGSGLDTVYPPEHADLAEQILRNGVIVSQFPLGTQAQAFTFPARNKIIAGLSRAIIVTEAKAQSGSLLTAEAGLKYGRIVGAVPGSIHYVGSAGPHQLIKSGARLVVDAADIVDTMATASATHHHHHPSVIPVTATEQTVLDQLQTGPQHIDELIRRTNQSAAGVASILAMLEIKGLVKQLNPGEYVKT